MTGKERAKWRAQANHLEPLFQVGKGGVTENMCEQIGNALEAREIIKLRVLDNSEYTAKEAANEIAENVGADVVQVIGTRFVLYRESVDHKKIDLSLVK